MLMPSFAVNDPSHWYGVPEAWGSGHELAQEIEEDRSSVIAPEDQDPPQVRIDRTKASFSLLDHASQRHGFPDEEGVITIHLFCPGCTCAAFLAQTQYEPKTIFEIIAFRQVEIPPTSGPSTDVAELPASGALPPPPTLQPPTRTSKKRRSNTDLAKRQQRAAEYHAVAQAAKGEAKFESQVVQSQKQSLIPGMALQIQAPSASVLPSDVKAADLSRSQKKNLRWSALAKTTRIYKFLNGVLSKKLAKKVSLAVVERAQISHDDFLKRPRSQQVVVNLSRRVGSQVIMEMAPKGDIFLMPHASFPSGPGEPSYAVMRWDEVIDSALNEEVWALWEAFKRSGYKRSYRPKKEDHRDLTPMLYIGPWSHYSRKPYLTRDSRPLTGQEELDALLRVVGQRFAPLILPRLKLYDINVYRRMIR
ncbi:hypothetical protein M422DRAFT_45707 [Sphaerobolus stellatus SS14]|nr:hypothetical protein M422DRAFT_45707 [Sphaerobolus stellatus SS14]